MKLVSLVAIAVFLSFSAAAQTAPNAAPKNTTSPSGQKTKKVKTKPADRNALAEKSVEITTLTSEKAYKARWSFEQMLARRLEVDAEDAERNRSQ